MTKTTASVCPARYAAIAGSLYAHFLNYVNGTLFDLPVMIQLMAMLVVGGIGTRWGPIVGVLPLADAGSLGKHRVKEVIGKKVEIRAAVHSGRVR